MHEKNSQTYRKFRTCRTRYQMELDPVSAHKQVIESVDGIRFRGHKQVIESVDGIHCGFRLGRCSEKGPLLWYFMHTGSFLSLFAWIESRKLEKTKAAKTGRDFARDQHRICLSALGKKAFGRDWIPHSMDFEEGASRILFQGQGSLFHTAKVLRHSRICNSFLRIWILSMASDSSSKTSNF